jgi:hypothetical protein
MLSGVLTAGCASAPPKHQDNLCAIFDQIKAIRRANMRPIHTSNYKQ